TRVDPNLLNDFNVATNRNCDDVPPAGGGDLPVLDLQTMEEFCQPTLNGRGGLIGPIHLDKFLHVTQSIKVNGVTDNALRLYLFPHSLTNHATAWFDRLPMNSITTFEKLAKMFLGKYFPHSMVTKLRNEITNFCQRPDESLFEAWERYKLSIDRCPHHNMLPVTQIDTFYNGLTLRHHDTINAAVGETFMKRQTVALKAEMAEINKNLMKVLQINQQVKAVTYSCETYGGPHSYNDCPATESRKQSWKYSREQPRKKPILPRSQSWSKPASSLSSTGLSSPGLPSSGSSSLVSSNMNTASSSSSGTLPGNTITNPKEDLKGITTRSGIAYKGPTIPTTSSPPKVVERETEVTKDTVPPTNNGSTKDVQPSVVQVETPILNSESVVLPLLSQLKLLFVNSLILMPKFGLTIKSLLTNKDKLFKLARTPLNEHCSAVLLKKLPKKLGDPDKFLIPCDFPRMDECLALADLGASINRMPLSMWNKLSLLELSPTYMTLELAHRSISRPVRVDEDVFVKTERALIDVYEGELTLHVGNNAVTFNLDQTSRYSANYDAESVNRIDIINVACEEYSQEVLGFFDEPILPKIDDSFYDSEGDILLLEEFLNDDPSSPPLPL
nr:hypothetical protein [Tanacetum cinerariifolium]